MSEHLGLIGNTIGSYQIQRKRRCFDPYTLYFEAIDTAERETYWLVAYPPQVLSVPGVSASIESELQELLLLKHNFCMHPIEVIRDNQEQYLFLVFPAFLRSIPLKELDGKLRPVQMRKLFYFLANVLEAAHDHGIFGNFDSRNIYIRRQGDDIDLRWYRTPIKYHKLLPHHLETTDDNEWWSYQSPEVIQGQPATPRSDFFSLGTLLFESLTGKRAFFHQVAEQVQHLITSGSSKYLERTKLTPDQLKLLQALHQPDPALRLADAAVFQETIRDMFQEVSKFPEVYPETSEHPALYVKESQPYLPLDSAKNTENSHQQESSALSANTSFVATPHHISMDDRGESIDPATHVSFVALLPRSSRDEYSTSVSTDISASPTYDSPASLSAMVSLEQDDTTEYSVSTEASSPKHPPSETEPHATAFVSSHRVMNLKKIHPLVVKIETSASKQETTNMTERSGATFSPYIRIVPVFPGCLVSPQEAIVDLRTHRVEGHFWIVPLASVDVFQAACVQLWHGGIPKDEIPVPAKIYSQIPTWIAAFASLLSFVAGFAFDLYGPQTHTAFKTDASLISHLFHQSITVFAGYGFWFGFFFLFVAGISYFLRRPQPADPIHYVLSQEIPSSRHVRP